MSNIINFAEAVAKLEKNATPTFRKGEQRYFKIPRTKTPQPSDSAAFSAFMQSLDEMEARIDWSKIDLPDNQDFTFLDPSDAAYADMKKVIEQSEFELAPGQKVTVISLGPLSDIMSKDVENDASSLEWKDTLSSYLKGLMTPATTDDSPKDK